MVLWSAARAAPPIIARRPRPRPIVYRCRSDSPRSGIWKRRSQGSFERGHSGKEARFLLRKAFEPVPPARRRETLRCRTTTSAPAIAGSGYFLAIRGAVRITTRASSWSAPEYKPSARLASTPDRRVVRRTSADADGPQPCSGAAAGGSDDGLVPAIATRAGAMALVGRRTTRRCSGLVAAAVDAGALRLRTRSPDGFVDTYLAARLAVQVRPATGTRLSGARGRGSRRVPGVARIGARPSASTSSSTVIPPDRSRPARRTSFPPAATEAARLFAVKANPFAPSCGAAMICASDHVGVRSRLSTAADAEHARRATA